MNAKPRSQRRAPLSLWIAVAVTVFGALLVACPVATAINTMRRPVFAAPPGADALVFKSGRNRSIDIYVISPDGTQETRLTYLRARSGNWWADFLNPYADLVTSFRPQAAANGKGITFISNFGGEDQFYQMSLTGSRPRQLHSPLRSNTTAVLSPNGEWIAYLRADQELVVIRPDGSAERCLTCNTVGLPFVPAWSPDSQQIVFPFHEGDQPHLFRVNLDGTDLRQLTDTPGSPDLDPAWSPDGQQIAFRSSSETARAEIYVMNADGSDLRRLTTEGGVEPAWSPDGQRIAYVGSRQGGSAEIYVMHADGSNPTQLTFNNSFDSQPVWVRVPATP